MIYINAKGRKLVGTLAVGTESAEVRNPYTGKSCKLEPVALALYDYIKGCEMLEHYGENFSLALMIFRLNWEKEYYILLD